MKKIFLFFLILVIIFNDSYSQELYINSEPASLIPKGTKVVRLSYSNIIIDESNSLGDVANAFLMTPSLAYGLSKKIMISTSFQFANRPYEQDLVPNFVFNGFKFYSKQRIYTTDKQKNHTRLSSFLKYSFHKDNFMKSNIDLDLQDKGFELGLIGTQLIKKLAISITSAYIRANDINDDSNNLISLSTFKNSLSAGYLLLPRKYKSYKQTNFNLYLEYLTNTIMNKTFPVRYNRFLSTLAPGLQFVILSRSRLDFSYKIRKGDTENEFFIKFTYIIY
tara:strand:+ start:584 stop:1417 length:834 start_codon:yes stop_codon:yes gene_type:complete